MTASGLFAPIRLWCPLLAGLAVAGCGRAPEPAGAAAAGQRLKVDFQLDWYPVVEHGGFYQALVKNYYRDAGLDVTITPGGGGPGTLPIERVGTGRAEFAMARCDDVILAVRQGLPLLIVCAQMQHDPQSVMVHEASPVRSLRDLDGKTVMANLGANWIAYVEKHYRINMNVVPMDYGIARFMADPNFIQQCFISSEPYFAELNGARTRTFLIAGGGYDPYRVIITNRAFARAHPEAVRAFVAASIRGWEEFLRGDTSQARAKIEAENPAQTPALMDYSVDALKRYKLVEGDPAKGERLGLITPERMRAMLETLVEIGVLDAPLPLEKFVSFDFLPADVRGR